MTTYQEYKAKIAELENLAESARKNEVTQAKEKIFAIMREYGLTVADLGGVAKVKTSKPRAPVPTKYRNDATGDICSASVRCTPISWNKSSFDS